MALICIPNILRGGECFPDYMGIVMVVLVLIVIAILIKVFLDRNKPD